VRLLSAELTKLRRPLTWCVLAVTVLLSGLFAWQGVRNAYLGRSQSLQAHAQARVVTCQDLQLPPGALCERAVAVQEQIAAYRLQQAAAAPDSRHNAHAQDALPLEQPLAAGKLALGFMASLPGALLILLLAAGHVANEWNGRTIKTVLTQEGRRWRILAAKAASLWIAAMGIVAVDWIALALLSPILKAAYPLGLGGLSWSASWSAVAADAARAPLVIAVFAALGVAAAVVVRNAIGAFAIASGILLASITAAGNLAAVAPWTLAWWVSGWMRFRSHGYVIYHLWVDAFPGHASHPGFVSGLIGVAGAIAVLAAVAVGIFRRVNIRV
jgi:ABC-type transport system involved in multi-copper enzyme maturation permease subunit